MTKKNATGQKSTPSPAASPVQSSAAAKKPSKRSRIVRYSLYALIIPLALLVRWWLSGPDIPRPDLDGADPKLVEDIDNARAVVWSAPRQPERWGRLGMLLAAHSFTAEAVQCFEKAGSLDPTQWRWAYLRAVALERGEPDAARDALREAADVAGDDEPLPRLLLAERLLEIGDLDEADRHIQIALRHWPRNPRANLDAARLRMARGEAAETLERLKGTPLEDPHTRRSAHQLAAQVHRILGQETAVAATLERLKTLPPDQPWPDQWREELQSYRTTKGAYIARIDELSQRKGDQERRNRAVAESINRYPELLHLVEGRRLLAEGDVEGAEASLREAVLLDPRSIDALISLGESLARQGKIVDAEDVFRRATHVEPTNGATHLRLGRCLLEQKQPTRAFDSLRVAVQFLPTVPEAHASLADALAAMGDEEQAKEHRRHAQRLKETQGKTGAMK
jgi:tetratricopeptide (TPR) repeat protein